MNEQQLIEQLQNELIQTLGCEIKRSIPISIPMHTVDVTFTPVIKKRMDILMKVLLAAAKTAQFSDIHQLSEMLYVEELFVADLIEQMQHSKLVEIVDGKYTLTTIGEKQLAEGVYEEQLDEEVMSLMYSPVHEAYFFDDVEELMDVHDLPESLLPNSELAILDEAICETIQMQKRLVDPTIYVFSFSDAEERQIQDVPYLAFLCFDAKASRHFIRAHSYLLNGWDDRVEAFLMKEQLTVWQQV